MTEESRRAAPAQGGATPAQRNRVRPIGIAAGAVAALIISVIGWGLLHPGGSPKAAPEPATEPGIFRPTPAQLAGFKIEPVRLATFRSERMTEGNIAIDDDLTTAVFSPYSGRVVRLIARLGDRVEPLATR
jgi:cobalt-zinc-cadmium efflux system membrane fusion protein